MLACPDLRYSALDPSASGPASQNEWKWWGMVGNKKKIGPGLDFVQTVDKL